MKIKTSELIGPALDYAVGKAQGWVNYPTDSVERGSIWHLNPDTAPFGETLRVSYFHPSTDREQGYEIVEREFIAVFSIEAAPFEGEWAAEQDRHQQLTQMDDCYGHKGYCFYESNVSKGPTPLIAAMRCFVASKLGEWVEIPDELA
jgi:hypothetical protein